MQKMSHRRTAAELQTLRGTTDMGLTNGLGTNMVRLLACTVEVQFMLAVTLAVSFLLGCWMIATKIDQLDLNSIQVILDAATNSAVNVEMATERVLDSISFASKVLNSSASSLESLNVLLKHPRLSIEMPTV